jgi:hypothetical protein
MFYISCPFGMGVMPTLHAAPNRLNFSMGSEHSIIYSIHATFFSSWLIIIQALSTHHHSFHVGFSKSSSVPRPSHRLTGLFIQPPVFLSLSSNSCIFM